MIEIPHHLIYQSPIDIMGSKAPEYGGSIVSIFGIATMVLGRYLVFGYLDPVGNGAIHMKHVLGDAGFIPWAVPRRVLNPIGVVGFVVKA